MRRRTAKKPKTIDAASKPVTRVELFFVFKSGKQLTVPVAREIADNIAAQFDKWAGSLPALADRSHVTFRTPAGNPTLVMLAEVAAIAVYDAGDFHS